MLQGSCAGEMVLWRVWCDGLVEPAVADRIGMAA